MGVHTDTCQRWCTGPDILSYPTRDPRRPARTTEQPPRLRPGNPHAPHAATRPGTTGIGNRPRPGRLGTVAAPVRNIGDRIGGYRVLGRLGSGGSGQVFRVIDDAGHESALKLVDARDDLVAAERLGREVRALQSLRHPAVPQIVDAEFDDDLTFVVFELVPGDTLFDHVQRSGPLVGEELASFAERTASALEAVHAAGVIHRDVTPSNIMMGPEGPVLIDFGLAHRADDQRLTREGLVSGTPGYVAPEVIDGAEPGSIADRWSWAATVAYALAGQAPFGAGAGAIGRTLDGDMTVPEAPGAATLRAALGRDVAGRPGMRDVVAALRGAPERVAEPVAPSAAHLDAMQPDSTLVAAAGTSAAAPPDPMHPDPMYPDPTLVFEAAPAPPTLAIAQGEAETWGDGGIGNTTVLDADAWGDAGDDGDGEEWGDSGDGPDVPAPARRRTLLLLGAMVTVVAAPLAPLATFVAMVLWWMVARGAFRRAVAIEAAAARRGTRRTADAVVHTLGLPWHLARAGVEMIPAVLAAAVLGGGTAAAGWWLVAHGAFGAVGDDMVGGIEVGGGSDPSLDAYLARAVALALGAVVAQIMLVFGPFMRGSREGAHRLLAAVAPRRGLGLVWGGLAVLAMVLGVVALSLGVAIVWWPLAGAPA